MTTRIQNLVAVAAALIATGLGQAAESATSTSSTSASSATGAEGRSERKELRVLSAPERRVMIHRGAEGPVEKETVAFLGVETGPVTSTVSAQLGLPRGTGLVVNHLVPKSPAAESLQTHDILLKLDDQVLIETRQLSVLIRNKKEGDEVTLTYLRGGKQATAKVKLGKQEVPKISFMHAAEPGAFAFGAPGARVEVFAPAAGAEREEVDRVLSLLGRAPGMDVPPGAMVRAPRIRVETGGKPGMRAISVNTQNSSLVYSDEDGSLDLRIQDGVRTLVAKNAKGEEIFAGPVTTPEQRNALPESLRARLDKLEGMRDVTFRTDGDFRGVEEKVIRPRGIMLPLPGPTPERLPLPPRRPAFL